jgi:hypothetical protein
MSGGKEGATSHPRPANGGTKIGARKRVRAQDAHDAGTGDAHGRSATQQKYRRRQKEKTSDLEQTVENLRNHLLALETQADAQGATTAAAAMRREGFAAAATTPSIGYNGGNDTPTPAPTPTQQQYPSIPEISSELSAVTTEAARVRQAIARLREEDAADHAVGGDSRANPPTRATTAGMHLPPEEIAAKKQCVTTPFLSACCARDCSVIRPTCTDFVSLTPATARCTATGSCTNTRSTWYNTLQALLVPFRRAAPVTTIPAPRSSSASLRSASEAWCVARRRGPAQMHSLAPPAQLTAEENS